MISQVQAQVEKLIFIISYVMNPKRESDFFFLRKNAAKAFFIQQ